MTRRILNVSQPIVGDNGTMERPFQDWATLVTKLLPYTGAGSPETVVEAVQYSHYYDTTGGASAIHYIKMLSDIGSDKSQGWVLA